MNRSEFNEMARNNMPDALMYLFDQIEAAELTVAALLGDHVEPVAE